MINLSEYKELNVDEEKAIALEILLDIHNFCQQENITYYLAYGTLIGAIRHQGFIPWDDDIDICMPRADYERFINSYKHKRFKIMCREHDDTCLLRFAKVYANDTIILPSNHKNLGIFIDIFPVDGLPEEKNKALKFNNYVLFCQKCYECTMVLRNNRNGLSNWLRYIACVLFYAIRYGAFTLYQRRDKCMLIEKKYDYILSNNFCGLCYNANTKDLISKKSVETVIQVKFENYTFNAPIDYDAWLKCNYCDYMQLPPESQRTPSHGYHYYIRKS